MRACIPWMGLALLLGCSTQQHVDAFVDIMDSLSEAAGEHPTDCDAQLEAMGVWLEENHDRVESFGEKADRVKITDIQQDEIDAAIERFQNELEACPENTVFLVPVLELMSPPK